MKKRLISSLVMILIIVPIIIKGGLAFDIAIFLVGLYSVKEMTDALSKKYNIPLFVRILSMVLFFIFEFVNIKNANKDFNVSYKVLSLVLISLVFPLILYNDAEKYDLKTAFTLFGSILLLCLGFGSITILGETSLNFFIFILLIPIFNDTFAYTGGLLIGKHLLCPKISPKKTWEGFITGIVLTTFSLTLIYLSLFSYSYNIIILICCILFLSLVAVLGDLFFSLIKRTVGIKDFSNLIPGHGGILDRLDSILFVFIAYSIIASLILV